ncbi:MAG: DNA polymerase III subunit gamma/tau [Anaerolineales bacterium]|nr:DNA polymerase III subunit gamma/tau [Anaerolineales bacterium]
MMNQVLYRKWRPQTWEDVVGQKHVVHTLKNALATGRIAHAYLFSGPRGTGKTSMARILAKAANCSAEDIAARPCNQCARCLAVNEGNYLDLIEIDAASNTSVEDVRDLRERVPFAPGDGRYKVYIIDEVHMLSTAAFNALLKTLEEPPAHAIFILATTEAHKIPATVVSRCQRHEFRRLGVEETTAQLMEMVKAEGIQADKEALEAVARQATGSMRDAISLLDQLGSMGEAITLARTLEMLGSTGGETVQQLVMCIARGDSAGGLQIIHQATDSGADARQFARQVVDYLRGVMMAASGNTDLVEATPEIRAAMKDLSQKIDPSVLYRAIRSFSHAAADLRSGWRPQLPLELALIDSILDPGSPNPAAGAPTASGSSGAGGSSRPVPQRPAPAAPAPKPAVKLAEKPPQAYAVAPPDSGHASGMTLARIRESWSRVIGTIRERDSRSYTLFARAQPGSYEGDLLSVYVDSDLVRQKCSRPETLLLLQGVLAEVLGSPLRIRFAIGKTQSIAEGQAKYPDGGMVDTASREFGAQVIDLP